MVLIEPDVFINTGRKEPCGLIGVAQVGDWQVSFFINMIDTSQDIYQSGFARTIGPSDAVYFSTNKFFTEIRDYFMIIKRKIDIVKFKDLYLLIFYNIIVFIYIIGKC